MEKKKTLFIIWSFSYGGGAEKILANIANNLNYEKYDIEILEYFHSDKMESVNSKVKILPPIVDMTKPDMISRIHNKLVHSILIKLFPALIRKIHLRKTYDVEISFNYLIPTFLLNKHSKKRIAWMHSSIYDLEENKRLRNKQRKALSSVDKIVAISNATEKSIATVFPEFKDKIIKIYNGYDFSGMVPEGTVTDFQLLYFNRFDENKDPLQFIRIVKRLNDLGLSVTAKMLGTGVLFNEAVRLIREYKLEAQIECVGYKKNPYAYYKHCKVFCLTSHSEGFPTTLVEAMYFGKPFVSTPVAGTDELSQNGNCGFVARDEEEYAIKLLELLTTSELYKNMSEYCSNYVINYSLKNQIQAIEENCL